MQKMASCCTRFPTESGYTPKGKLVKLDNIEAYSVGPTDSRLVIVFVYDIFGFHPTTLQTVDKLSEALNVRIVAPDYFDGKPYPLENFPPKDFSELFAYLEKHVPPQKTHDYTLRVYEALKKEGYQFFGTGGLCWGARVCMSVADTEKFQAGHALYHPSFIQTEDARTVKAPILMLPSKEEADMLPFMELLKEVHPEVAKKSAHHRFDDMHHGFCGARGDWNDPVQRKRIEEAIAHSKTFFENNTK